MARAFERPKARWFAVALTLIAVMILHATGIGVLVGNGAVEDRGEGGPSFDCYYLATIGPVRVGYFYSAEPEREQSHPAPRSDCPWLCMLEKHPLRLGARTITAWQCASREPVGGRF